MFNPFDVFFDGDATRINAARMQHLASLSLELAGKSVLEVGAGIGRLTDFFEELGCLVLSTDGRPENVTEIRKQYPHRRAEVLDLEAVSDLSYLGKFDVVFCYGTLYHLQNPEQTLKNLAEVCQDLLLLETCVTPGDELEIYLKPENKDNPNQAYSGIGCRPTRPWVMTTLKQHFEYVYLTRQQPHHPDFDLDWQNPIEKPLHRAVFVASRTSLSNAKLSETILDRQTYEPESQEVWIEVGTDPDESMVDAARANPHVVIYTFRPGLKLEVDSENLPPNYVTVAAIVADQDGINYFCWNQQDTKNCLSLLDEQSYQRWVNGEQLSSGKILLASTLRLDTFLNQSKIRKVSVLKADVDAILSLGDRGRDISKLILEVENVRPTHSKLATRADLLQYFHRHGFVLIDVQPQTQGEKLTFVQKNLLPGIPDLAGRVQAFEPDILIEWLKALAVYYPLQPYPGWKFDIEWSSSNPGIQICREIWNYFKLKNIEQSIQFSWYFDLTLHLHLGNDLSSQLLVGGCYEPNELYFLSQILTAGMVVLDVGANEGFYSLFASRCVGTEGSVFCFEPSQREFDRLQKNIDLNAIATIHPFKIALSDFNGEAQLKIATPDHSGQNTLGDFIYAGVTSSGVETVAVERLDDWVDRLNIQHVDVIKLDVEGAEFAFLKGAQQTLSRFRPLLLLELIDIGLAKQGSGAVEVLDFLRELGYEFFEFGSSTGLPLKMSEMGLSNLKLFNSNIVAAHPGRTWNLLTESGQMQTLQLELEQTQQKLQQTARALHQAQQQIETLHATIQQHVQADVSPVHQELHETRMELGLTQGNVRLLQARIEAMESSKFWSIRAAWLKLKRSLGLARVDE